MEAENAKRCVQVSDIIVQCPKSNVKKQIEPQRAQRKETKNYICVV